VNLYSDTVPEGIAQAEVEIAGALENPMTLKVSTKIIKEVEIIYEDVKNR